MNQIPKINQVITIQRGDLEMKEKSLFRFRAWDTHEEVMNRVDYIDFANGVVGLSNENVKDYEQPIHRVKFMPSTGLKDKKGLEIYEGDIVGEKNADNEEIVVEVVWRKGAFYGKEKGFEPEYLVVDFLEGEVIGNRYENKEL